MNYLRNILQMFFCVFILFFTTIAFPGQSNNLYRQISFNQLRNISTSFILQDKAGFLWFTSYGGVYRWDGYSYLYFLDKPSRVLCEDKYGNIWVGTWNGVFKIEPSNGKVTRYQPHPSVPGNEWKNNILSLHEDRFGFIWIGTSDGLNRLDPDRKKFVCFTHNDSDPSSLLHNSVSAIYEDKNGALWLGTGRGLDQYDYSTGKFIHVWKDPEISKNYIERWNGSKYWISAIYEDKHGAFWLGTSDGLVELDKKTGSFILYKEESQDTFGLSNKYINTIDEDKNGSLWIGTQYGLNIFERKTKQFIKYYHEQLNQKSLSDNTINKIIQDDSGILLLATDSGVDRIEMNDSPFKNYKLDANKLKEVRSSEIFRLTPISSDKILVFTSGGWYIFNSKSEIFNPYKLDAVHLVFQDKTENLWFCSDKGGIYRRTLTNKIYSNDTEGKLFDKTVTSVYESKKGGLWLGTYEGGPGGIYFLSFKNQQIKFVQKTGVSVFNIYEDHTGLVWASTIGGGLIRYDPLTDKSKTYYNNPDDSSTISSNSIWSTFYEDTSGNLWFNSDKFERAKNKFVHIPQPYGVLSILGDDYGNMWICTYAGIERMDPVSRKYKLYDISHGFENINFNAQVVCKTKSGEMYFGGLNGFIRFHPDSIRDNQFIPPVVITSIKKFDKPSVITNIIKLPYNENFLSFEFAALSYVNPENNKYAYKMEGLDKDWIYSGTRRYTSYPNLAPGKYIFRVKGSNNDGVWNEEGTSITIIISPPWWKTWWAYSSYFLIFVFSLYGIRKYEMNRLRLKDKIKMDEAVLIEREETDKIKSRFFANISHEFRTPLTLILGPAEKINSQTSSDIVKDSGIIKRNSKRLLQLVNQLLDLSKLEAGRMKLEASKNNIVSFVKGIALSFESLSEEKDITLKITSEKDLIELYFDKEKMLKILSNILSNAFKFTPQDGKIMVSIIETHTETIDRGFLTQARKSKMKGFVEIKIRDTGIGIRKEEIPKLFDRFYQVDSSFTREFEGTGIGLALTKELVELHYGSIKVESEIEQYTEFTLNFPLGREHLKDDEILIEEKTEKSTMFFNQERYLSEKNLTEESIEEIETAALKEDKTIILIVEDNYDMREYIKESLGENYIIEEAANGEQGIRKALKIIPDLIISDMMMPKMDGNEMTKFLKNDEKTSHIPIIILTARSGQENKLEGLQTGADDYLTKPFDLKEIQIRIENLITIRKKLQEKFGKIAYLSKYSGKKLLSIDEQFINKVLKVIEDHISEEDFSIEDFGSEVGMSRTQLYRKLKAVTGMPASIYLRTIRLSKAKKMIEDKAGTISEVSYSVGFSSPSYFTKCFKEEFGYLPSEENKPQ